MTESTGRISKQSPNDPGWDRLADLWRAAPPRWGHRSHSLCSYLAMFPPAIPRTFIDWVTDPGDLVWDPFSGRGTTAFEACLAGRRGIGSDMNPLALLLTGAKVDPPTESQVKKRLSELSQSRQIRPAKDAPSEIRMLFHPQTLGELLWMRDVLDSGDRTDRYLLALLVGGLHANANRDGTPRGLTIAMPNTFAMAPDYVRRYIDHHGLEAPRKDVVDFLRRRLESQPPPRLAIRGKTYNADVRLPPTQIAHRSVRLVFTSPPYLQVVMYGKYNWPRLWLLGTDRKTVDGALFHSSSLDRYLTFMGEGIRAMSSRLRDDGFLCMVVGDVRRGDTSINLAEAVAAHCFAQTDLRVCGIVTDNLPTHLKVSRIWGTNRGRATKTDRVIVACGPRAKVPPVPQPRNKSWWEAS